VSRSAQQILEFDKLKEIVGGYSTCASGRRAIEALAQSFDATALNAEFALVREAAEYLRGGSELGLGSLRDPEEWLARLAIPASVLTPQDLLNACTLVDSVEMARAALKEVKDKFPLLALRAAAFVDQRWLTKAIRHAVLPNGEISDDASPQLRRIRTGLAQGREKIQRSLESILRGRGESTGGDYITLRNDRFVIPVRASDRRAVPGVMHGASGTGQTVFVEPLEAIDLNNRLVQLSEEELEEISRILQELTERVRGNHGPLAAAAAELAHFDSIFARGRYARDLDCTMPEFSQGNALRLENARNPVLEATLRPQGRKAVPLSIAMGGDETIVVISGPNTGGKTVALKSVGLAAFSAQASIPVAAETAVLPIFDHVLADIGDEQSIAADLSTFSAHVMNLKSMLEVATDRSLILVDEMGTGTAPEEGAALAVALLEEFRMRRALTIATTHHDRLKSYASTTPGILNAAMEFDEEHLRPTYRLLVGVPGTSSGIEIARRLGLPERVIQTAQSSLSTESREARELIAYLHKSRDEMEEIKRQSREELAQLESERHSLRTEWIERQRKRIADLERNFAETQKRLEAEVTKLTVEIQDRTLRAQLERQSGRRISKMESDARAEKDAAVVETLSTSQADLGVRDAPAPKAIDPNTLAGGERIMVKGFKQPVIFRRHDGRMADVEAGPLRMRVPIADIVSADRGVAPTASGVGLRSVSMHRPEVATTARSRATAAAARDTADGATSASEINVIGRRVEEATELVDKFIDDAALAGRPSVRIIHGHGTGALRRGLAEFLSAHPLVERIRHEAEDRGGQAITIADLHL
jgi:DNA mismatch repair protein MutS2